MEEEEPLVTIVLCSRYPDLREKFENHMKSVDAGVACKLIIKDTSQLKEEDAKINAEMNKLVSMVTSKYVCLMNDDVYPLINKWLLGLVHAIEKYNLALVGPNFTAVSELPETLILRPLISIVRRGYPTDVVSGGCLLCRTEDFMEVGGYDENFEWWYDDTDLTWRMTQLKNYEEGAMLGYLLVHHPDKSTTGRNPEIYETKKERSRLYFNKKWGIKEDGIKKVS